MQDNEFLELRAWERETRNEPVVGGGATTNEIEAYRNFSLIQHTAARNLDSRRPSVQREGGRSDSIRQSTNEYTGKESWSRHFDEKEAPLVSGVSIEDEEGSMKLSVDHEGKDEESQNNQETDNNSEPSVRENNLFMLEIFGAYFSAMYFEQFKSLILATSHVESHRRRTIFMKILLNVIGTTPWTVKQVDRIHAWYQPILRVKNACLRGIAQVYFCNNPFSGSLILIGLFVQSTRVAVHGIIAVLAATLGAFAMEFEASLIDSGLYGYNAMLVGLGISTFFTEELETGYSWASIFWVIISALFTVVLFTALGKLLGPYKCPPSALPFDLVSCMFLLSVASMVTVSMNPDIEPRLPDYTPSSSSDYVPISASEFFTATVNGVGQVYFVENVTSSVIIIVGLALCSRIVAINALIGSLIGTAFSVIVGIPTDDMEGLKAGIYSYCPSLTFSAMMFFYVPSFGSFLLAIIAAIFTFLLQLAFNGLVMVYGLPFMSFPFNIVIILFILIQGNTKRLIAVPLESITTPEDHLKRIDRLKDGIAYFLNALEIQSEGDCTKSKRHTKMSEKLFRRIYTVIGEKEQQSMPGDIKDAAMKMFSEMSSTDSISTEQFSNYLRRNGLTDRNGIEFATQALQLMDFNKDNLIDKEEWTAFCMQSIHIHKMRMLIAIFFNFVDENSNGIIEVSEINQVLKYLHVKELSHDKLKILKNLSDGKMAFRKDDLINFVCISTLKRLISDYHEKKD